MHEHPELFATRDLSRIFDRSDATIRLWVRTGKLRAIKLPSGQNVFTPDEVARVREQQRQELEPAPAA